MSLRDKLAMNWLDKYRDFALLLMRGGAGIVFIIGGWQILERGRDGWHQAGVQVRAMSITGIGESGYVGIGLAIAVMMLLGGVLLIIGLVARFAATAIFVTQIIFLVRVIDTNKSYDTWSPVAMAALLLLGLMVMGPGKHSMDYRNADEEGHH
ncbi:MAG: DoxX family protein [Planctomycetota bacterium]